MSLDSELDEVFKRHTEEAVYTGDRLLAALEEELLRLGIAVSAADLLIAITRAGWVLSERYRPASERHRPL